MGNRRCRSRASPASSASGASTGTDRGRMLDQGASKAARLRGRTLDLETDLLARARTDGGSPRGGSCLLADARPRPLKPIFTVGIPPRRGLRFCVGEFVTKTDCSPRPGILCLFRHERSAWGDAPDRTTTRGGRSLGVRLASARAPHPRPRCGGSETA
jgi:hypothetical protein